MTTASLEVFTPDWAERFRDQINSSDAYRRHGSSWHTPIALEMSFRDGTPARAVELDLNGGMCHGARCVESAEARERPLVISASVVAWQNLLAGTLDPIWAMMSGRLKLVRGSLTEVIPYSAAAKALVEAAATLQATFPAEKGP